MDSGKTGQVEVCEERGMTAREVLDLPVTINVVTAARALGMGPNKAYQLVRSGEFPVDMITVGGTKRVLTAALWKFLQLDGLAVQR
ncbi:helix-turn-helix domain-containing protein [Kitasatospora sp. NBC_01287]|uniref:DNA-binding protein n=1 Tax=Kitasatospora sp. NBC_01287 TaxID=2903573 RepID=UPI0022554654|nr:DNA-binding protein [Kitasatospora sp. NBC_01287]MCX4749135.1 helix-turn-helix domain-containing protein [Kitasatospora sp. NBC_01287]